MRRILILLGFGLAATCWTHGQKIDPTRPDKSAMSEAIIDRTNAIRTERGLPALRVSANLNNAAQLHTDDMKRLKFFAHENSVERSKHGPGDRIRLFEYDWASYRENIVYNWFTVSKPDTAASMARRLLNTWMNSKGHRANILSKHKDIGASMTFVPLSDGKTFKVLACQIFGNPKEDYSPDPDQSDRPTDLESELPSTPPAPGADLASSLLGKYENVPPTNDWHKVTIESGEGGKLRWKNAAGKSWLLELRDGKNLWSGKDSPYGEIKHEIKTDGAGNIKGLQIRTAFYRLVGPSNPKPVGKATPTSP